MRNKRKNYGSIAIFYVLLFLAVAVVPASANQSGLQIPYEVTGDVAYDHVYYLSETIGSRVAGTTEELDAADYIAYQFEQMGYEVEIQLFSFERRGVTYESQNIIATKQKPETLTKLLLSVPIMILYLKEFATMVMFRLVPGTMLQA